MEFASFNLRMRDVIFLVVAVWWPCLLVLLIPLAFIIGGIIYNRTHPPPRPPD